MQPLPVSTVLLTKNSAASLPAYFASMRETDDIIVLDGGSTDGTLELCRAQPNVRVFPQNPAYLDDQGYIMDFSAIRNEGYALARHPWILCVDSDEAATPSLLHEVRRVVEEGVPGVYYVRRTFLRDGRPVVALKNSVSDHIRLFHRDCVRGCVKPVHERLDVIPGSPKGYLDADISVPLPNRAQARKKYDRCLRIEVRASGRIGFRRWFRWVFLRTIVSTIRRIGVIIVTYLLPKRGPRYPLGLEYEQMRYSWLVMIRTFPWRS